MVAATFYLRCQKLGVKAHLVAREGEKMAFHVSSPSLFTKDFIVKDDIVFVNGEFEAKRRKKIKWECNFQNELLAHDIPFRKIKRFWGEGPNGEERGWTVLFSSVDYDYVLKERTEGGWFYYCYNNRLPPHTRLTPALLEQDIIRYAYTDEQKFYESVAEWCKMRGRQITDITPARVQQEKRQISELLWEVSE